MGNYERKADGYPAIEEQLLDNYTGWSVNGAIGFVIGGGVMQDPKSIFTKGIDPTFSEIGIYVPQLSVGASYTSRPFNLFKEKFHW